MVAQANKTAASKKLIYVYYRHVSFKCKLKNYLIRELDILC